MRLFVILSIALFVSACSSMPIAFPNACPEGNTKCQRNLDAQTLAIIGYEDAATQLLCEDTELRTVLGDKC